jgi:hypothetical protein
VAPRTYPALGFDPAPGIGEEVTALATQVSAVAREVSAVRTTLESIGRADGSWRGEAATAFAGTLGELPPYLRKATDANEKATGALTRWARELTGFQTQAAEYERQAEEARSRLDAARVTLRDYRGTTPGSDPAAAENLRRRTAEAQTAVNNADAALAAVIARARQLAGAHGAALREAAATIRQAADAAPPEPGFWEKVGDALGDAAEWVAAIPGKVDKWIEENKYLIKAVGDFLSDLALVVGTVSLFLPPPADVIGLGISGVLALGAMGAHGLAWAYGAEGINALTLVTDGVAAAGGGFGIIGKLGGRGAAETIAIGNATNRGGMVAAGTQASGYYTNVDNAATVGGWAGTATGWTNNAAVDGELRRTDIPFSTWVPRSDTQVALLPVTGLAGTAFVNYVSDGTAADDAANAQADRERWIR